VPLAPGRGGAEALFRDPAAPDVAPPLELDGILLTGEGISTILLRAGTPPLCGAPDVERDSLEMALLDLVRPARIPILAIAGGFRS